MVGTVVMTLTIVLAVSLITSVSYGDDIDRLATCVAMADVASEATKARDTGVSPAKAMENIEKQMPDESRQQVSRIVSAVYSDRQPSSDDSPAKTLAGR